jgi:TRAP-type mannitol/chloroaromatic compound transport system permease small subunit
MDVTVKDGKVEVEINKKIYDYKCVLKTKDAFKKDNNVSIKKGDMIYVTIKPKKKVNLELLGYEFFNHLLNTLKEMKTS